MYPMRFLKFFLVVFLLSNFQEVLKGFHILKSQNIIKSCKFSLKLNLKNFEILLLTWILKPHFEWNVHHTWLSQARVFQPYVMEITFLISDYNWAITVDQNYINISVKSSFLAILSYHYRFSKINYTLIFI